MTAMMTILKTLRTPRRKEDDEGDGEEAE